MGKKKIILRSKFISQVPKQRNGFKLAIDSIMTKSIEMSNVVLWEGKYTVSKKAGKQVEEKFRICKMN